MIIVEPNKNVLDFDVMEWLLENIPSPKKDVQAFLRAKFNELKNEADSGEPAQDEDEADDGGHEDEEDDTAKDWLVDSSYGHFSLAENGSILLIDDDDSGDILLVGADAETLRPKLAAKAASIAKKLESLLGK